MFVQQTSLRAAVADHQERARSGRCDDYIDVHESPSAAGELLTGGDPCTVKAPGG